jgi:hypothetical protein
VIHYTLDTLPNNLPELRTGTANDGRMLIKIGSREPQRSSALSDIRVRLPKGWTAEVYEPSGIDAVITHVGEVVS